MYSLKKYLEYLLPFPVPLRYAKALRHNKYLKTQTFYVLLTVNLGIIFVSNQLDAQFFFTYVYFYSLHVSGSHLPIIRRINCINTTSGICHSV